MTNTTTLVEHNKSLDNSDLYVNDNDHDRKYLNKTHSLYKMLTYARPSKQLDHPVYKEFLKEFIEPYFGKPVDEDHNYVMIVPDKCDTNRAHPRVMYTSHHDTVHAKCERLNESIYYYPTEDPEELLAEKKKKFNGKYTQPSLSLDEKRRAIKMFVKSPPKIKILERTLLLDPETKRMIKGTKATEKIVERSDPSVPNPTCLGADCTTGIWIMLNMIKAEIPGVYCIFAKEEIGRIGSEAMAKKFKDDPEDAIKDYKFDIDNIEICISFDRKGYSDIITHQSSQRTASDSFAKAISDLISPLTFEKGYPALSASKNGSFTDSYSFRGAIPECTNLPVGYFSQHTTNEEQDLKFASMMADAMIQVGHEIADPKGVVVVERDPSKTEYKTYGGNYYGGYGATQNNHGKGASKKNETESSKDEKEDVAKSAKKNVIFLDDHKKDEEFSVSEKDIDQMLDKYYSQEQIIDYDYNDNFTIPELAQALFDGTYVPDKRDFKGFAIKAMEEYPYMMAQFIQELGTTEDEILEYFIMKYIAK